MALSLNPLAEHVLSETSQNFTWDIGGPYRIEGSWILPVTRVMVHLQVHKAAHAFVYSDPAHTGPSFPRT